MWVQMLSYLEDIFHHLSQLIKLLQSGGENMQTSSNKNIGFKEN